MLQIPFFNIIKQRFALVKLLLVSRRNNLAMEWAFSCFIGVKSWAEAKEKGKGAGMNFL